ncbi:DUF11 domain-containing protein [Oscillochloris sp. ZM17-4]|uniref:DUF11 domain-containing protein n=1 Tax=Oscillochloris sp. ZM17-4 TaxID=2866714 RepID=UPI001C73196D|nr:DUF11 domain-containing protein [Oscillochloris sp. ZM17-4]MBX0327463.1 DUF11 domain-containing protein [Oscillochloris sp. ZM17-4]
MNIAFSRVALFVTGLAFMLTALLMALAGPVGAAPSMLVTETASVEPATRTATPIIAATSTPIPPTETSPPSPPTATSTPVPSGGGGGSNPTNTPVPTSTPEATMTPVIQIADPAITKSVSVSAAQVGDTVEFTLTATNLGNAPASNVVVEDTLPSFLALDGVSATRGTVTVSGATIRVDIGDLAPGEVVTVTITARVVASAAPPNNSNVATIISDSATDDPGNNSSSVSLTVDAPPPASLPNTGNPDGGASLLMLLALGVGLNPRSY